MVQFRSASCPRPVRLREETRQFAFDSLNGKYGQELRESDHLALRREEAEGLTPYQLYDLLIMKIAKEAGLMSDRDIQELGFNKDLDEYREDLLEDKRFELKMAEIQKEINELRGPQTAPAPQPANTEKEDEEE